MDQMDATAKTKAGVSIQAAGDPVADAAGIKIMVGTQDLLHQPTALVNKNTVVTGNNVAITRSNIIFTQNDRLALVDTIEAMIRTQRDNLGGKMATSDDDASMMSAILAVLGSSMSDTKMVAQVRAVLGCREHKEMMRQCITALVEMASSSKSKDESSTEQVAVVPLYRARFRYPHGGGFRYGWRYPLSYWNLYGRRFYPSACDFGHIIGSYYYC
uniref:Uncharacterized protein n=2 Tax=Globisporangium ultimum (strain ATCC 200006 / CBS 805.95 / DAOM BR144) TaxID=431595 RepID=K3WDW6_GLOUD